MSKLTNVGIQDFLASFEENAETTILEEGKEKDELNIISAAREYKIKGSLDLAMFKTVYAFTDIPNDNGAIIPKDELLRILPQIVGKPVNLNHNRRYVIGHYVDYRYVQREDKIIAYGVFYKSHFKREFKEAEKLFRKRKLSTSFEIWSPKEKREYISKDIFKMHQMEISGGALIFEDNENEPAFKNAKVLEFAKKSDQEPQELVYASKYKEAEMITSAKSIVKSEETVEESTPITRSLEQEIAPIQPTVIKTKCSNCSEEFEISGFDTNIKCPKCLAIVNQKGEMLYPPQIKDFRLLCPSCKVDNWLILSNKEDNSKIRCLNCAKEYAIDFKQDNAIEKQKAIAKLTFLYTGTAYCPQCGNGIVFEGSSKQKQRECKCPKCGLSFTHDITKTNQKRVIASIKEMEVKPTEELIKSKKEGGKTMEPEKKIVEEVKKEEVVVEPKEEVVKEEKVEITEETAKKPSQETAPKAEETVEVKPAKETPKAEVKPKTEDKVVVEEKKVVVEKPKVEVKKEEVKPEAKVEEVKKVETILADVEYEKTFDTTKEDVNELTISKVVEFAKLNDKFSDTDLEQSASYTCECLKCGKKTTTSEHCNTIKCSSCGGDMRRASRPGRGRSVSDKAKNLTYKERKVLTDNQFAVVVTIKNKKTGKVRKIRRYPINDKANIRHTLSQLSDKKTLATLEKLGADVKSIRRKITAQAKKIVKASIIQKRKEIAVNLEERTILYKDGINKLAKQLIESKKQVELYKTEAKKIISRQDELGEYANDITEEDILNDDKFELAKLEKEKSLQTAAEVKIDDIVGGAKKDDDYYAGVRKKVREAAFGKKNKKE